MSTSIKNYPTYAKYFCNYFLKQGTQESILPRKYFFVSNPFNYQVVYNFRQDFYYPQHILTAFAHIRFMWIIFMHMLYFLWIKQENPLHLNGLFDIIVVFSPWI